MNNQNRQEYFHFDKRMHRTVSPVVSKFSLTPLRITLAVFDSKDTASQLGRDSLQNPVIKPLLAVNAA